MTKIKDAALDFLAAQRIAVPGVSPAPAGHGSNAVFLRLRARGYQVFAVNPHADEVEGEATFGSLGAIPGGVEAVVIGTRPEHAPVSYTHLDVYKRQETSCPGETQRNVALCF